jgi:hypothetical protein
VPDDFVLNLRQIFSYPPRSPVAGTDLVLLQDGSTGAGPYYSAKARDLVSTALQLGGSFNLAPGANIAWNGAALTWSAGTFSFSEPVHVPSLNSDGAISVAGQALATQVNVDALFDSIIENSVWTVNGRTGNVQLITDDILRAGGAPISDAHFGGFNTSPTPWDFRANSDQIATTAFVQMLLNQLLCGGSVVTSFNGRGGDITLTTADVNAAFAASVAPVWPMAPSPALGDASNRIATTLFVDESIEDALATAVFTPDLDAYAPLNSPIFTGLPSAPTANPGTATAQLATTAFVMTAVAASVAGVSSFNTRTGAVVLDLADITGAGGAPSVSPNFTGVPMAPTAAVGTSTQQLATTAFVINEVGAIAAGVASFNGRSGIVTLTTADVTGAGGAPIVSPNFTGNPSAPTPPLGNSSTYLATTAFVAANTVSSWNGRVGAVTMNVNDITAAGGVGANSPTFTGIPIAPTAPVSTSTQQLATTAFVAAALAASGGVASFNGRAGAVTLTPADIAGANGALLLSNGKIVESHAANSATFSVVTLSGATPSPANPVLIALPDGSVLTITAALSFVTAAATFGVPSATPFRLWFAIANDAGTPRLLARTCSLRADVAPRGIAGFDSRGITLSDIPGNSAMTTYSNIAITTAAPYRLVGYADYDAGLTTAGAWASSPTRIMLTGPGLPRPGDAVQSATNGPFAQLGVPGVGWVATNFQISLTVQSPINPVAISLVSDIYLSGTGGLVISRDANPSTPGTLTNRPLQIIATGIATAMPVTARWEYDWPSAGSHAWVTYIHGDATTTTYLPSQTTGGEMTATELMG